jgi:hypothetical protein
VAGTGAGVIGKVLRRRRDLVLAGAAVVWLAYRRFLNGRRPDPQLHDAAITGDLTWREPIVTPLFSVRSAACLDAVVT